MSSEQLVTDETAPRRPNGHRHWRAILICASIAVVLAVAGTVVALSVQSSNATAAANASASAEVSRIMEASASASASAASRAAAQAALEKSTRDLASAAAKALADAAKRDRASAEAGGWTYVNDYLYYASPTVKYTCPTRYKCARFAVTTTMQPSGCPGGIGLSISFTDDNGLQVYNTARSTGALRPGEQALVDVTDLSGMGTTFRVDSMRCYS